MAIDTDGCFERFYTDTVTLYSPVPGDYGTAAGTEYIGDVKCDVQPVSGSIADMQCGLHTNSELKMFSDENDNIKPGNYAEYDGMLYIITRVDRRRLGLAAYLKRREP